MSRLTVIIPTRERHDTLRWAITTGVKQDCDDFEILVSDNASVDATREVVESFDDPRVRYVNPGSRIGMSEHWEFALSHVEDGYVMFLGDDDGLMPGAAQEMRDILVSRASDALVWPLASYYWPEFFDRTMANGLSMPVPQPRELTQLSSADVLTRIARFEAPHYLLPSPYWGAVNRQAFDRVIKRSGRVFHSINPDLSSGVAVAAVTDAYLRSERMYTLSGVSRHSNGASHMMGHGEGEDGSKQEVFWTESGLPFHPDLDMASNVSVLVAESLLQVRDHVDPQVPTPELGAMYRAALTHADHVLNPQVHDGTIAALRATAERSGTNAQLDAELERDRKLRWPRRALAAGKLIATGNPLIDLGREAANIYEATLAADRILASTTSPWSSGLLKTTGRANKLRRSFTAARQRLGS